MAISPLYGHEGIRNRLAGAIASGRLPQALLFEGPRGVGKQRLALWLAQALVCETPETGDGRQEGCGRCRQCKLVLTLSHPDVHWFVPVELSKRGGDADKQVELVEEALAEQLAARRAQPHYEPPSGLATHGIGSVRLLLRRLALRPALAARRVCIIGDAERLVPQRANPEAANALLKTLEEPSVDTVFVLTAAEPEALPATILSRVVRVRVSRLPDSIVTAFAQRELGLKNERAVAQRVAAAEGCIGKLLAESDGDAGGEARAERLVAALRGGAVARYSWALAQPPFQARGAFTEMLDGLLGLLREQARTGRDTAKLVSAMARVLEARDLAQGNVNPQLLGAVLAEDLGGGKGRAA